MALVMGEDETEASKRKVSPSKVKSKGGKKVRTEESLDDVVQLFDATDFVVPQSEADEEYNGQLIKAGVSVDEWNKFLSGEHRLRGMLWFDNGNVYIVEVPNRPHENAVHMLSALIAPLVVQDHVQSHGANRWIGTDNIGREADLSYSPVHAPPMGVNVEDYVTFVIEVGHSQTMGNLRTRKVAWFANYPTVYYVLLISISTQMNSLRAELWRRGGVNAIQIVNFSHLGGHLITLNTRRLLGIVAAPLPGGLGVNTQINLDRVQVAIRR